MQGEWEWHLQLHLLRLVIEPQKMEVLSCLHLQKEVVRHWELPNRTMLYLNHRPGLKRPLLGLQLTKKTRQVLRIEERL